MTPTEDPPYNSRVNVRAHIGGATRLARWVCFALVVLVAGQAGHPALRLRADVDSPAGANPGAILSFADHLFSRGDYYRAITEYRRYLFFAPRRPNRYRARWQIARSFFKGRQWTDAAQAFAELARTPEIAAAQQQRAGVMVVVSYFQAGSYRPALQYGERLLDAHSPAYEPQLRYLLAWCRLRLHAIDKASAGWLSVAADRVYGASAKRLVESLREFRGETQASPATAGVLAAVLPGAGFWYLDRRRDAGLAFILNAGFIVASLVALQGGNYALGALLLLIESGWYSGNILASISAVHRQNRRRLEQFIVGLQAGHGLLLAFDS